MYILLFHSSIVPSLLCSYQRRTSPCGKLTKVRQAVNTISNRFNNEIKYKLFQFQYAKIWSIRRHEDHSYTSVGILQKNAALRKTDKINI